MNHRSPLDVDRPVLVGIAVRLNDGLSVGITDGGVKNGGLSDVLVNADVYVREGSTQLAIEVTTSLTSLDPVRLEHARSELDFPSQKSHIRRAANC